jgi:hypothetical protein
MLNLSGFTTRFKGGRSQAQRGRRPAGVEVLMAVSTASQMALLYPPGIDELVRRELEGGSEDRRRASGAAR